MFLAEEENKAEHCFRIYKSHRINTPDR